MIQIFWDQSFKVRTLKPFLADGNGVDSPVAINSAASVDLKVPTDAKTLILSGDVSQSSTKTNVKLSYTGSAGVFENGSIDLDIPKTGVVVIPLEGVELVKLTNSEGSLRNISFTFLVNIA